MRILKEMLYWLCILTGLTWVAARLNRRKVLVLYYHGVYGGALNPVLNFDGLHVRVGLQTPGEKVGQLLHIVGKFRHRRP